MKMSSLRSLARERGRTRKPVRPYCYSYNTILFKFSYPDFTGRRFLIYYKLDGFDNEWIEGTSNFQRTYSNLPYGNFVLHAVVKDDRGKSYLLCLIHSRSNVHFIALGGR